MIRMEIALILILAFVAGIYFSARRRQTALHKTFSVLLIVVIVHLMFDAATIYTVNHLAQVPLVLNDVLHRLFVGTMALVLFFFYQYIAILVEEETGKKRTLDLPARIFLVISEVGAMILPITYTETPDGNYSAGLYAYVSYVSVAVYLILCSWLLLANWKRMDNKKKFAIGMALIFEFTICFLQGLHHTWLISGMGITLMTLAFYLTLENPDALRAELTEQKMSMLYLKSQVNPHFLYNTLDTIVWLVEGGMQQDAVDMITSLSVFFRTSLSKGKDIIPLSEEERHTLSYLEIQQSRYRDIMEFEINIPPELDGVMIPKLTLQPLAENALYHGIKNKRGKGKILIEGFDLDEDNMMIRVTDNGQGMTPERLHEVQEAIRTGERAGFGLAAVSERIKLYYGPGYGLKISSTEGEGTVMEVYMAKKINLNK